MPKLDEIKLLLQHTKTDILAISESWLTQSIPDSFLIIDNYHLYRRDRPNKPGGGIIIYIHQSYAHSITQLVTDTETLQLVINFTNQHAITVIATYKPPNINSSEYLTQLSAILKSVKTKEFVLTGDVNLDYRDCSSKPLKAMAEILGLHQIINEPTRICNTRSSILDLIFTNQPSKYAQSGVIHTAISDHFLVYTIRKNIKPPKVHQHHLVLGIPKSKLSQFNAEIGEIDWSSQLALENPEQVLAEFHDRVESVRKKHITTRKFQPRQTNLPWMNSEILHLLKQKTLSLKMYRLTKSSENRVDFAKIRNKCTYELRKAKAAYYQELIIQSAANPKTLWQTLKTITGESVVKLSNNLQISHQGALITEEDKIASAFNDYFIKSVNELAASFEPPLSSTNVPSTSNQFSFSEITQSELAKIFNFLNKSNAKDVFGLNMQFYRTHADCFMPLFLHLINLCIRHSIFPSGWKTAKIIPIYKSEDPTLISNYRPISILPVLSKLLEKTLSNQLIGHLESNNLLHDSQFGFRSARSTLSAQLLFTEYIRATLDKGLITGAVFIDFRKAFDTVNHQILQNKLVSFQLSRSVISMISSYLTDRSQLVKVGQETSPLLPCSMGVPQGSILGPLLFIMYLNDLPNLCKHSQCLLYADDTVIYVSDPSPDSINTKLTLDLQSLNDWLTNNHLTINVKKTECMYFHSSRKSVTTLVPVSLASQTLTVTATYKYLGVILDSQLTYRNHVHNLTNKLKQKLYVYNKIRPFLTQTVSNMYLHAIILSKLSYCLPIWSLTTKEITEPLTRLYNRAFKIHSKLPNWTHHCTALSHANALTFQSYTNLLAIKIYFQI